jgi:hypothetical protein
VFEDWSVIYFISFYCLLSPILGPPSPLSSSELEAHVLVGTLAVARLKRHSPGLKMQVTLKLSPELDISLSPSVK